MTGSVPLVDMRLNDVGGSVPFNGRTLKRRLPIVHKFFPRSSLDTRFEFSWPQLCAVDAARRSLILYRDDGRSCRFVAIRASVLKPALALMDEKGVRIVHVRWTIPWYLKGGSRSEPGQLR